MVCLLSHMRSSGDWETGRSEGNDWEWETALVRNQATDVNWLNILTQFRACIKQWVDPIHWSAHTEFFKSEFNLIKLDRITQWGDTWTVKDTSVPARNGLKPVPTFCTPRPPQQSAAFHQAHHGSHEGQNTPVSGHNSPEEGWQQPRVHGLQNPLARTGTWTSGPIIHPMSREVWSGACMTGPIVTPAPRMTCRRKNTRGTYWANHW